MSELSALPEIQVERLSHYFSANKLYPDDDAQIKIEQVNGVSHALKVVEAGIQDYEAEFGA